MDPATRRLALIAGGLGGALLVIVGGWSVVGHRSGTVLECDGDRVFITQDNGAELDFRASDLTATPPPGAKASGAKLSESREAASSTGYAAPWPSRPRSPPSA